MRKITEVTRRDIIDIIRNGFVGMESEMTLDYYEHQQTIDVPVEYKMTYHGRLDEITFLSRIYDLKNMSSTDYRFESAEGDIWHHTISHNDWDEGWVFSDVRFGLIDGDDEIFLKFICEMFHPIVRNEHQPWKMFLETFNELLKLDGYEIIEKSYISGRAVYGWKKVSLNTIALLRLATSIDGLLWLSRINHNMRGSFYLFFLTARLLYRGGFVESNPPNRAVNAQASTW